MFGIITCLTGYAALTLVAGALSGCATLEGDVQESPSDAVAQQQPKTPRPSANFRTHHAEIIEHLGHVDAMARSLPTETSTEQRQTMATIIGFFKEHIAPHAADEERILYPAVQRQAGPDNRLTEVPIYEHTIVGRWIAGLEAEAAKAEPNVADFARDAFHLVGLLRGHFEVEEQVLLPVLDRSMTPEQFQREIADKMPH